MKDGLLGAINDGAPKDPRKAAGTPGLDQQVLISWGFIFASITLTLGFIFLQTFVHVPTSYFAAWPNVANMTFMASCLAWLAGFMLLQHWVVYAVALPVCSGGFIGCFLKLVAAVFFNMQPISSMWEEQAATAGAGSSGPMTTHTGHEPGTSFGFDWSNLTGICLFHTGNVFSVYSMMQAQTPENPAGFNYRELWSHSNLPAWGMWVYLLATTFLVTANALAFFADEGIIADEYGLGWPLTGCFQVIGGSLLTIGSFVYLYWSTATNANGCACITP